MGIDDSVPSIETFDLDLDVDFDGLDIDAGELDVLAPEDLSTEVVEASGGVFSWLGLGKMPTAIWLALVLVVFGLGGLTVQNAATGVLGAALPAWLVAIPMAAAAFWFAGRFGALFTRLLPKSETQALSERHLGRRTGVVTQGTAARGRPAEVRVTDRHGNTHYLRAEPLRDDAEFRVGTEVLVLRHRTTDGYLLVALNT